MLGTVQPTPVKVARQGTAGLLRLQEPAAHVFLPFDGGFVKGSVPIEVYNAQVQTCGREPAAHGDVVSLSRPLDGVAAVGVASVKVSPGYLDKPLRKLHVALPHRPMQGAGTVLGGHVDVTQSLCTRLLLLLLLLLFLGQRVP
mgnify:CR=1 FL=1